MTDPNRSGAVAHRVSPPIVFDLVRLFLAASVHAPRGIDRVDMAYARFLFGTWPAECLGLLPTPWGLRLYGRERVLRGLDRIDVQWRERADGRVDTMFAAVKRRLTGAAGAPSARSGGSGRPAFPLLPGLVRLLAATGVAWGRPAGRSAPLNAIYLNIGQLGWAAHLTASWLRHRPDIRPVYMLHDVIPIERPELVPALGHVMHKHMMAVAARHAAALILTTQAAAASVRRNLRAHGQSAPAMKALHLPVAPAFLKCQPADAELAACAYFVVIGAIERRKNHLMLIDVWQALLRQRGERTPYLVIAGTPSIGARLILRQLQNSTALQGRVIVASGLSSPALRQLIAQARAVLMPSLAEGFGLPVIEALTVGTPVLASDLPAHREVGSGFAVYLDPDDAAGWLREITRFADGDAEISARRERIASYAPMTSAVYFAEIMQFLESLA